jgi:predicted  nucleic acid-binding Zn-ribbon protein
LQKILQLLIELQEIERKSQALTAQKALTPMKIAALEDELGQAEMRLQEQKDSLESLVKSRRQLEVEVEDLEERAAKSKQKLLAVKSNKEYQAILKEIDDIDQLIHGREDQIIEHMESTERVRDQLRDQEQQLENARQKMETEGTQLKKEAEKADALIQNLKKEEEKLSPQIPTDLLRKYQFLKANRSGVAVAPVSTGTCQVCHMNLPPQLVIELQKDETMLYCPSCQRIIYWMGHEAYQSRSRKLDELE